MIRYASAILTLAGLLALVSGLLLWTGNALNLVSAHMLLGRLSLGALTVVTGLDQASLLIGAYHWVIRLIHLLLGIVTLGLSHMGAARYRIRYQISQALGP